ncbi:tRNA lysidine(34) synthetase TilS [Cellulomonas sp. JH27-2]|uniref:tRNA lysidine(34) synthetase TilS n=1 Tax=Cellulomonas sp. JH27-2 TaxID=2774139 RepID=UPI00177B91D9|nr:tRNA lysidine(34) synthetase TilS [Cellulomonas sp. JH27-2]MBD8059394.1 tRNA lysidine(34) synthetase TilS [Cellulomonas sp. JH27-2]
MAGPHPAVAAARSAVRSSVVDLAPGSLVLVACSGGTDSLALAAATAFVAGARLRAGAVVVDHGLQPGSAAVAERAAEACRALGLAPVLVVRVDVGTAGGPEAAARGARYAALEKAAADEGAAAVLVGHTLDDQAETVLLGLARGSGARSLAGMPAVRGILRRPLLGLTRAQTAAACEAQGLDPWHDPTNAGAPGDPLRSRLRAEVMPLLGRVLGPGVPAALARTAAQLAEDADTLDAQAAELVAAARVAPPAVLDVGVLAQAPVAVRRRAVRAAAVAAGSPAGALLRVHVLALDALVVDWRGQGPVDLPGGLAATRACGRLVIGPPGPVAPVQPADVPGQASKVQSGFARNDDEE